jgi:hypothetical protein
MRSDGCSESQWLSFSVCVAVDPPRVAAAVLQILHSGNQWSKLRVVGGMGMVQLVRAEARRASQFVGGHSLCCSAVILQLGADQLRES